MNNHKIHFDYIQKFYFIKSGMFLFIVFLFMIGQTSAVSVEVSPSIKTVTKGQSFDLNIIIDPQGTEIAGAQLNMIFDKSIVIINDIEEGNFFKQNGASTFFGGGKINNSSGTAVDIFGAIIGKKNVSTKGTFIKVNLTAVGNTGTSGIELSNVKISDSDALPVNFMINNGSICISQDYVRGDVNCDNNVDMGDVIDMIYYTGYPGQYFICNERAADMNGDGDIDIADLTDLWYYVTYPG